MVVQHNLRAMNSNRMLGVTQGSLASSTEKLSSGYQINRAADNAAGLSISEKMRKQIRGLDQASANAEDGISSVQTAEGALQEVTDMLQRMNELAVQAANGTNATSDRQYIQDEVDQLVSEIDRVAETSKFNETYLLKGDSAAETKKVYTANYSVTFAKNEGTNKANVPNKIIYNGTSNIYFASATIANAASTNPESATVIGKGGEVTKFLSAASISKSTGIAKTDSSSTKINSSSYVAFQNTSLDTSKLSVSSSTGKITSTGAAFILDTATNQIRRLSIGEDLSPYIDIDGTDITSAEMNDRYRILARVDGATAEQSTGTTVSFSASKYMEGSREQQKLYDANGKEVSGIGLNKYYNESGNYVGGLFSDAQATKAVTSSASINSFVSKTTTEVAGDLSFNLHVGADSSSTNKINTKIASMSAAALGIDKLSSNSIGIVDSTGQNATDAIDVIAEALQKVSTQRSALGAVQNRLEHTIKNLDNIVENTTSAESAIRDTDMATEMVKYSNTNILSQAGQSMLAQSNQGNQGVLSLLG